MTLQESPYTERLLNHRDAMSMLACDADTLFDLVKTKTIPAPIYRGKLPLWFESDIVNYIAELRREHERREQEAA